MTKLGDAIAISDVVVEQQVGVPQALTGTAKADSTWLQGRTLFGGVQAGLAVAAVENLMAAQADAAASEPRPETPHASTSRDAAWAITSVMAEFSSPIPPGPLSVRAEATRTGGSTALYSASLSAQATPCAHFRIMAGVTRPLSIAHEPAVHDFPDHDQVPTLPSNTPGLPAFAQHVEYKPALGDMGFTASADPRSGGYCRLVDADPANDDSMVAFAVIADAWPPPVVPMLKPKARVSSVHWHVSFTAEAKTADPAGWWAIDSEVIGVADGYIASATHYYQDRVLLGTAHQTVAVFEAEKTE